MREGPVLAVRDLSVSFGDTEVLRDFSFDVHRGQTVALVGPNGSGKSVLLRTLLGLVPHRGSIRWARGTRFGYVPQTLSVDRDLPFTVREFFSSKRIHAADTVQLLWRAGLGGDHTDPVHARTHVRDHILPAPLGTLSGGQLQRVMVAFALAGDPTVLLFDEPTSGIDVSGQQSVYALLERLKREHTLTLLLVSHDLDVVFAHADHVICVNKDMVCHGPPRDALDPETLRRLYQGPVGFPAHTVRHEH